MIDEGLLVTVSETLVFLGLMIALNALPCRFAIIMFMGLIKGLLISIAGRSPMAWIGTNFTLAW